MLHHVDVPDGGWIQRTEGVMTSVQHKVAGVKQLLMTEKGSEGRGDAEERIRLVRAVMGPRP